jgi:hypothetical protein
LFHLTIFRGEIIQWCPANEKGRGGKGAKSIFLLLPPKAESSGRKDKKALRKGKGFAQSLLIYRKIGSRQV